LQPHFEAPALILYDRVPNGVGLAERIFDVHREILRAALALVQKCACRSGCPSCIGPSSSLGARSKGVAVSILQGLLGEER
jgi:DEAD/DEAH box helicase domain-containing protein